MDQQSISVMYFLNHYLKLKIRSYSVSDLSVFGSSRFKSNISSASKLILGLHTETLYNS